MKLNADDSRRLLCDLNNMCSPEEAKRRTNLARQRLAEMTRPKFKKSKFKEIIKQFIEFALRRNRSEAAKVHRVTHDRSEAKYHGAINKAKILIK